MPPSVTLLSPCLIVSPSSYFQLCHHPGNDPALPPSGCLTLCWLADAVKYDEDVLPWFAIWTSVFTFLMFSLKLERYTLYLPHLFIFLFFYYSF